jgi:hypothetical protein
VCAACGVALGPNLEREIAKDDRGIAASQSVALRNLRGAWPRLVELTSSVAEPDYRNRVTNETAKSQLSSGVVFRPTLAASGL